MTRVRYNRAVNGERRSKTMLAGSRVVYVLDNVEQGFFQIIDADDASVLHTGRHKENNLRMKLIKNSLAALGVLFQQETRIRTPKLTGDADVA